MMELLLKSLKITGFLSSSVCPYRFFATIYHVALSREGYLIELGRDENESENFGLLIQNIGFEDDEGRFCMEKILKAHLPKISNERQAGLFVIELLQRMDHYLAGTENYRAEAESTLPAGHRFDSMPVDELHKITANPEYYRPIEVQLGQDTVTYSIAPRIESMLKPLILKKLLEKKYYSSTVGSHFLQYHTLVREGRESRPWTVITNGLASGRTVADSFHRPMALIKEKKKLVIGMSPFDEDFILSPVAEKIGKEKKCRFRYSHIEHPSKRQLKKRIRAVLDKAMKEDVDILIFPELTIDHDCFTELCRCLSDSNRYDKVKLVIAGSFHKEREEGGYVNRSAMLDWKGDIVWRYCKQNPFELSSHNIQKSPSKGGIQKAFSIGDGDSLVEDIFTDCPFVFMDTPIGRMSTLICLDYIHSAIHRILPEVPCDYLFVPAMSPGLEDFKSMAKDIYSKKHHILTACCNSRSCPKLIKNLDSADDSFLSVPWINGFAHGDVLQDDPPLIIFKFDISGK